MGLRLKPNCRADFDPAEFSVVCGNDRAAWLLGGNSAREVSPPRDFSQHDGFKGKRLTILACCPCDEEARPVLPMTASASCKKTTAMC